MFVTFLAAVVIAATLSPGAAATQHVSDGELQRFLWQVRFPSGCGDATVTAKTLRARPTTDPATLRAAAATYRACATGPYGVGSNPLANEANFASSAASLLAARHASPAAARADASAARDVSKIVVDYRRPSGPRGPNRGVDLSQFITDAGRINRDAVALLSYDASTR